MLDLKMFRNLYFFYTLVISSFLVICIGTGMLLLIPDTMIINYVTLVTMALYCLTLKFHKTLANFIYIVHLLFLVTICYLIRLDYTQPVIMCLGIPAYLFNEVKLKSVTYRIEKYLKVDKIYSKKKYFLYLIPVVLAIFGLLIYVADNSERLLTVYDLMGAGFLLTALIYTFKENDISWTFRIAYNTVMLLIFQVIQIDPLLVLMQLFKVIVCIVCFFEVQYTKEKYREIKNKNTDNNDVSQL